MTRLSGTHSTASSPRVEQLEQVRDLLLAGKAADALVQLQPMLQRHPKDPNVLFLITIAYERLHQPSKAIEFGRRALRHFDHDDIRFHVARAERTLGNTDASVELCDELLAKTPTSLPVISLKAGALEEAGRFAEARACLEPVMQRLEQSDEKPTPDLRYEWSKLLIQNKEYDEALRALDALDMDPSITPAIRRLERHLKAKAHDRRGDYAQAFEAATQANEIDRLEFDPALYEEQVSTLIENWSADRIRQYPRSTCSSEAPVFIAGMPRSGTSLIDQIIDAHPSAAGVGELSTIEQFAFRLSQSFDADAEPAQAFTGVNSKMLTRIADKYVREVRKLSAPGTARIVNKALGNNKLVGLLALLFPKTRIIHAVRDPRDVAISCYMGGFNNRLHAWTTRIDWVAQAWEQSMRMMRHWKEVLDIPILEVHYEELVRDPDTQFPRLIEFLGLEWDDACRSFYKSRRTVRTLSYDQVNRPLYTTSAGRHANYEPFLERIVFPSYDAAEGVV